MNPDAFHILHKYCFLGNLKNLIIIGDSSEDEDRYALSETHQKPISDQHACGESCGVQSEFKHIYLNILIFKHFLLIKL